MTKQEKMGKRFATNWKRTPTQDVASAKAKQCKKWKTVLENIEDVYYSARRSQEYIYIAAAVS